MEKKFEQLDSQPGFQGFFRLDVVKLKHTLFAGGWSEPMERELFQRGDCVAAVLYDARRDQLVLIEQFRVGAMQHAGDPWLVEIVAGAIESGETPEQVVRREAQEEAGCEINELIEIQQFYTTPGGSSERIFLYCGLVNSSQVGGIHGLKEEQEDIRVFVVSFEEAMQMLDSGRIQSGIPLVGLHWLSRHRDRLREQWSQLGEESVDIIEPDAGC